MGREEINALIAVLEAERDKGTSGHAIGTWSISYDKVQRAFVFNHCEADGYCEEKPAVISVTGEVLDPGGPLFG